MLRIPILARAADLTARRQPNPRAFAPAASRPGYPAAALACALLLAACGRGEGEPPEPGDTAVATVNDQTVWASDVKREATAQGLIGEGDPLDLGSEQFHRVLDEVIDQKLLAAEADKKGLQNDPVAHRRLDADRDRILADLYVERLVRQAVNDGAVKALYQEQVRLSTQSEEFHARQIVLASQPEAEAARRLVAGGQTFESVATQRSIDPATRDNGGDLGYFTADVMPATYAAALRSAKTGQVIGPFQADAGWVLLKLEARRPAAPIGLDQARPQIVRFLTYDAVRDGLQQLRARNRVKLLIGPPRSGPPDAGAATAPPQSSAPMASARSSSTLSQEGRSP